MQKPKMKLVMVGNGMAGMRTIETLLERAPDMYDITVFGAEPRGNYNRIMLSPVLADELDFNDILLHDIDWYAKKGITLHCGSRVCTIDRKRRMVIAENGLSARYDRLLLATGSYPFILPVPGVDLEGVMSYRDMQDVENMLLAAKTYRHAVVIGGGLLGLEAANGLNKQGMQVSIVHACATVMEKQLDAQAGAMLQSAMEKSGIRFLTSHFTAGIKPSSLNPRRVGAVYFNNGEEIPADIVVMAVGIRPNCRLAEESGLRCDRGVIVDDTMQTFDPGIYAVGECAQHRGVAYGLVAPLYEQAKVCASHLAEEGIAIYQGSIPATKLKVTGIDVYSAGEFSDDRNKNSIVFRNITAGVYRKLVINNNRITGVILYGDTRDSAWYYEKMLAGTDVSAMRRNLVFGRNLAELKPDAEFRFSDTNRPAAMESQPVIHNVCA